MLRTIGVLGVVGLLLLVPATQTAVTNASVGEQTQSSPTEIESCTEITEPGRYVLTADIQNSSQAACIEIRASDVALDGNGHVLDGVQNETRLREFVNTSYTGVLPNATDDANLTANATTNLSFPSPTSPEWANVGIAANASEDISNVSVEAVEVREFFYGIYYDNVTTGTVRDVTVARNGDGLDLFNSSSIEVTDGRFVENQWGLFTHGVTDGTVDSINASANGETGVYVQNSTAEVSDVTANDNGAAGVILDFVNESSVTNVTANENRYGGIALFVSENNTVRDSSAVGNGHDGISLQEGSVGNLVADSIAANTTGADDLTASLGYSAGIVITNGSYENTIRDVVAANNTNWTFYATNTTGPNTVENLTIDSQVGVSFTGTDVAADSSPESVETDARHRGLFVANTSADAQVENLQMDWLDRTTTEETTTIEETATTGETVTTEEAPTTEPTPATEQPAGNETTEQSESEMGEQTTTPEE